MMLASSMNNRFKFRVWDKITNQYLQELGIYYWHIPYSLDGEEIIGEANLVGLSELLRHDNFVTQQYIGLNDINGKEVYEGDILEFSNHIDEYKIGYIGFTAGNFYVNFLDDTDEEIAFLTTKDAKVIGNMFETPELLK